jgi:hypothetical protein
MKFILYIGGVLSGLCGLLFFSVARSSIHEIGAFVLFLICAVLISGAIEDLRTTHRV